MMPMTDLLLLTVQIQWPTHLPHYRICRKMPKTDCHHWLADPDHVPKTDAKNITDAIRFACEGVGGVYVVFDGRVIQGTRAIKLRTKSYDAFESINYPYIAFINEDGIEYNKQVTEPENDTFTVDTSLCTDVCLLKSHPGLKPEMFDALKSMYKGIVIESYGAGGVPFEGRDILSKVNELIESGIVVVITTQCLEEGKT